MISLGSLVGFLTVLGIVARNGIMLISHVQHLERGEGVPFGPELVMRGAIERQVPIMMTVLTTGLALIPLLVYGSIPGQEIEHPMTVVILGGLVTATLLNLFVDPSLYLRIAKRRRERLRPPAPRPPRRRPDATRAGRGVHSRSIDSGGWDATAMRLPGRWGVAAGPAGRGVRDRTSPARRPGRVDQQDGDREEL